MRPAHRRDAARIESRLDSAALLLVSSRSRALLQDVVFDSDYMQAAMPMLLDSQQKQLLLITAAICTSGSSTLGSVMALASEQSALQQ